MAPPKRGLFITGTDTDVGKTYVTCLIVEQLVRQGRRVGVYKPVESGGQPTSAGLLADDAQRLWQAAGKPLTAREVCPQVFQAPLAPHLAAAESDEHIDQRRLVEGLDVWRDECDIVLVEGAGGLMSPVSEDLLVADLALEMGYPLVVVAPNRLGVISQTLQTLVTAHAFRDGLNVAGIVLNDRRAPDESDASAEHNLNELRQRCQPPVIGNVPWQCRQWDAETDWFALADIGVGQKRRDSMNTKSQP